jgi:hypothetical protein
LIEQAELKGILITSSLEIVRVGGGGGTNSMNR